MNKDFAVFILSHGRANNMLTVSLLEKTNYTGRWYIVIDNEDDQREIYQKNFGRDKVIIFEKQPVIDATDTIDSVADHRAVVYARNKVWDIAKQLDLRYFLVLDDDYNYWRYRYVEGQKLKEKIIHNADWLFDLMLKFLTDTKADCVALAQGGDYIGGVKAGIVKTGIRRKVMNSFFCKTDNPFYFTGTTNEDTTMYTTLGSQGRLFLTPFFVALEQVQTQKQTGGLTDIYLDNGTYVKSFYSVISMPSAVEVSIMGNNQKRIHHRVNWDYCVPKIINEKWRKTGSE